MTTKREEVWAVFKSKGAEDANKLGLKLGIPEGQMKRVIRAMTNGTWAPPKRNGDKKKKAAPAKKAKAAPTKKATKKAPEKKAAPAKKAKKPEPPKVVSKRVHLTYDKKRKGTMVRQGEHVSTIKFDQPGSQKEEHIVNKVIVEEAGAKA